MRIAGAARLFALQAVWRSLGIRSAGRALVHELGDGDDDLRTIAGMFLVRAGKRSIPYLRETVQKREHLEMAARVIGDLGALELEPELRALSGDSDPAVATAARDALRLLSLRG